MFTKKQYQISVAILILSELYSIGLEIWMENWEYVVDSIKSFEIHWYAYLIAFVLFLIFISFTFALYKGLWRGSLVWSVIYLLLSFLGFGAIFLGEGAMFEPHEYFIDQLQTMSFTMWIIMRWKLDNKRIEVENAN